MDLGPGPEHVWEGSEYLSFLAVSRRKLIYILA